MKERRDNYLQEGDRDVVKKKFKPSTEDQSTEKVCPLRRKGAPEDQECMACGS